jgi:hypothetical protein
MEYKGPKKDTRLGTIGEGVGGALSICIFAAALFLITAKWSLHSLPAAIIPKAAAGIIAIGAASALLILVERPLPTGAAGDLAGGIKKGMTGFGHKVSHTVNFILLSVLYFTGVGLVAVASKAAGKKFLDMRYNEGQTYYKPVEKGGGKVEDYLRQF